MTLVRLPTRWTAKRIKWPLSCLMHTVGDREVSEDMGQE